MGKRPPRLQAGFLRRVRPLWKPPSAQVTHRVQLNPQVCTMTGHFASCTTLWDFDGYDPPSSRVRQAVAIRRGTQLLALESPNNCLISCPNIAAGTGLSGCLCAPLPAHGGSAPCSLALSADQNIACITSAGYNTSGGYVDRCRVDDSGGCRGAAAARLRFAGRVRAGPAWCAHAAAGKAGCEGDALACKHRTCQQACYTRGVCSAAAATPHTHNPPPTNPFPGLVAGSCASLSVFDPTTTRIPPVQGATVVGTKLYLSSNGNYPVVCDLGAANDAFSCHISAAASSSATTLSNGHVAMAGSVPAMYLPNRVANGVWVCKTLSGLQVSGCSLQTPADQNGQPAFAMPYAIQVLDYSST